MNDFLLKKLHEHLLATSEGIPSDFSQFKSIMSVPENAKVIHQGLESDGEKVGDFNMFYSGLGFKPVKAEQKPAPVAQAPAVTPLTKEENAALDAANYLTPDDLSNRSTDPRVADYTGREERMADLGARTPSTQQPNVVADERSLIDKAFTTPNSPLFPIGKALGMEPEKTTHQEFVPEEKGTMLYDINNGYKPIRVSNDQLHAYLNNEAQRQFKKPLDQLSSEEQNKVVGEMASRYMTPDAYNKLAESEGFSKRAEYNQTVPFQNEINQMAGKFTQSLTDLSMEGLRGFLRGNQLHGYDPEGLGEYDEGKFTNDNYGALVNTDKAFQGAKEAIHQAIPQDPSAEQSFLLSKLPEGVGSTVPFMLPGGAGLAMGAFAEAENLYQDAKAHGADDKTAMNAFMLGLPIGATEALPISRGMERLAKMYGATQVKGALMRAAAMGFENAAIQGVEEGIQEGGQNTLENLVAKTILAYDPDRKLTQGLEEAMKTGAAVGAVMGGIGGVFSGARSNAPTDQQAADIIEQANNNPAQEPSPEAPVQPEIQQSKSYEFKHKDGTSDTVEFRDGNWYLQGDNTPLNEDTQSALQYIFNQESKGKPIEESIKQQIAQSIFDRLNNQPETQQQANEEAIPVQPQEEQPLSSEQEQGIPQTGVESATGGMGSTESGTNGNPEPQPLTPEERSSLEEKVNELEMILAQDAESMRETGQGSLNDRHGVVYELEDIKARLAQDDKLKSTNGVVDPTATPFSVGQDNGISIQSKAMDAAQEEVDKINQEREDTGRAKIGIPNQEPVDITPIEGESTVNLPPLFQGGQERVMVFKDGEWQISFGGKEFTRVSPQVQQQAQEAFSAANQPEAQQQVNEETLSPAVSPETGMGDEQNIGVNQEGVTPETRFPADNGIIDVTGQNENIPNTKPTNNNEDALPIDSPREEVSRTGEGGENLPQRSEDVLQGIEGNETPGTQIETNPQEEVTPIAEEPSTSEPVTEPAVTPVTPKSETKAKPEPLEGGDARFERVRQNPGDYRGFFRVVAKHGENLLGRFRDLVADNPIYSDQKTWKQSSDEAVEDINDMIGGYAAAQYTTDTGRVASAEDPEFIQYIADLNNNPEKAQALRDKVFTDMVDKFHLMNHRQRMAYLYANPNGRSADAQVAKMMFALESLQEMSARVAQNNPQLAQEYAQKGFELMEDMSKTQQESGRSNSIVGMWPLLSPKTADWLARTFQDKRVSGGDFSGKQQAAYEIMKAARETVGASLIADQQAFADRIDQLVEENETLKAAVEQLTNLAATQAEQAKSNKGKPKTAPKESKRQENIRKTREAGEQALAKAKEALMRNKNEWGNRLSANPFTVDPAFIEYLAQSVRGYVLLAKANIEELIFGDLKEAGIEMNDADRAEVSGMIRSETKIAQNENRYESIKRISKAMQDGIADHRKPLSEKTPFDLYTTHLISRVYEIAAARNAKMGKITSKSIKQFYAELAAVLEEYKNDPTLWKAAADKARSDIENSTKLSDEQKLEMIDELSDWIENNGIPPFRDAQIRRMLRQEVDGIMSDSQIDAIGKRKAVANIVKQNLRDIVRSSPEKQNQYWDSISSAIAGSLGLSEGSPLVSEIAGQLNKEFKKQVEAKRRAELYKSLPTEAAIREKVTAGKQKAAINFLLDLKESSIDKLFGDLFLTFGSQGEQLDQLFHNFATKYNLSMMQEADFLEFRRMAEEAAKTEGSLRNEYIRDMMKMLMSRMFPSMPKYIRQQFSSGSGLSMWEKLSGAYSFFNTSYWSFYYPAILSGPGTHFVNALYGLKNIGNFLMNDIAWRGIATALHGAKALAGNKAALAQMKVEAAGMKAALDTNAIRNAFASAMFVMRNGDLSKYQEMENIGKMLESNWADLRGSKRRTFVGRLLQATDMLFNSYYINYKTMEAVRMHETQAAVQAQDMKALDEAIKRAKAKGSVLIDPNNSGFRAYETAVGGKYAGKTFGEIMDAAEPQFDRFKGKKKQDMRRKFAEDLFYEETNYVYQHLSSAKRLADYNTLRGEPGGSLQVAKYFLQKIQSLPIVGKRLVYFIGAPVNALNLLIRSSSYGLITELTGTGVTDVSRRKGENAGEPRADYAPTQSGTLTGRFMDDIAQIDDAMKRLSHRKSELVNEILPSIPPAETARAAAVKEQVTRLDGELERLGTRRDATVRAKDNWLNTRKVKAATRIGQYLSAVALGAVTMWDDDDEKWHKFLGVDFRVSYTTMSGSMVTNLPDNSTVIQFKNPLIPKWSMAKGWYYDDKYVFYNRTDSDDMFYLTAASLQAWMQQKAHRKKDNSNFAGQWAQASMFNAFLLAFDGSGIYSTSDLANEQIKNVMKSRVYNIDEKYDWKNLSKIGYSIVPTATFVPQMLKINNHGARVHQQKGAENIMSDFMFQKTGSTMFAELGGGRFYPTYNPIDGQQERLLPGEIQGGKGLAEFLSNTLAMFQGVGVPKTVEDRIDDKGWQWLSKWDAVKEITPRSYSENALHLKSGDRVLYGDWNEATSEASKEAKKQLDQYISKGEVAMPFNGENIGRARRDNPKEDAFLQGSSRVPGEGYRVVYEKFERQTPTGTKASQKAYIVTSLDNMKKLAELGAFGKEPIESDLDVDAFIVRKFVKELYNNTYYHTVDKKGWIRASE